MRIPFNKPYMTGKELSYIAEAHANSHLAGDGAFTRKCSGWLEAQIGCRKALLTHSCTAALEMAAILADLQPGDEVIMPSFTFVSTANAFVLRGAIPVFVDVRPDTFNIDESKIEAAITARTRAIVPVHYAGVGCEMDAIMDIAERHGLIVIEDAAQGVMSRYKGRPLGSIGHLACLSFHETKNLSSGEGGALLINDPVYALRAEIIREKGTNRSQFFRGQVDKYTWCDLGSSYLPSELNAAFLMAQMEEAQDITLRRLQLWQRYHEAFAELEQQGRLRRPQVPASCGHNAHMYYLLLPDLQQRTAFIEAMRARDIGTVFHYVPLHSAPAGQRYGRAHDGLEVTQSVAERLVRLPLWVGLESDIDEVISSVVAALGV
ncbi:dTDP-4-amino-4,6-dideoxygalactose transaminase [Pseudomonas sp. WS 5013]|uniref:dTDP-4-amino-4,6-dideoxygalactose transaminase n=1 Tax=Pseudomonas sp. WS 5013 TaxID=2717475 RepID=UPI00147317F0|nr:dTDP-4-amino-4,6-dideoxygalactose transaminase [Pseudomonas sp. WS 5013]NMY43549.1 dTDP-4-amino-4,6-dideoxygalactose transaminase [Pseudomonas sp. WS 5013]